MAAMLYELLAPILILRRRRGNIVHSSTPGRRRGMLICRLPDQANFAGWIGRRRDRLH
jgi:hypothetical protein